MGMLRIRFIGNKNPDPTTADFQYAILIERARDHAFLNFKWFVPPTVPGQPYVYPPNWTPTFDGQPPYYLELLRMKNFVAIPDLLDEVWWLDLDVTKFTDDDYNVYFYSITDGEMQYSVLTPIIGGDDMSLAVRMKRYPVLTAFSGAVKGMPGVPVGTEVTITGRANVQLGLPKAQ